jgi:hypothetical protein
MRLIAIVALKANICLTNQHYKSYDTGNIFTDSKRKF